MSALAIVAGYILLMLQAGPWGVLAAAGHIAIMVWALPRGIKGRK